jgi:chromosomal replication initiation ATPase DnaA
MKKETRTQLRLVQAEIAKLHTLLLNETTRKVGNAEVPAELAEILEYTAETFDVSVEALVSPNRTAFMVSAKTAFITAARNAGFSWLAIGKVLNCNHASAIYLYRQLGQRLTNFLEHKTRMEQVINTYAA